MNIHKRTRLTPLDRNMLKRLSPMKYSQELCEQSINLFKNVD